MSAFSSSASQIVVLAAAASPASSRVVTSQYAVLTAYAPPATKLARSAQITELVARSGGTVGVVPRASQLTQLVAYRTGVPDPARQATWTFILDGHRMWVVPLGPEGDWAWDVVTKQWCRLRTQGFDGLNFSHGVMWGLRIMGGDLLYNQLYELDPNQPNDEGWRPVEHIVTGGLATRGPNMIGCANFRLTASAGVLQNDAVDLKLTFSDDNGHTWVGPFTMTLAAGAYGQTLVYSGLGSFAAPGRIFQVYDSGGLVRIDGADAALNNYDEDSEDK